MTEDFRAIGSRVRNWGRWGEDDARGTLNLITAEAIIGAAALIRRGAIFNLGIPIDSSGPQTGRVRINPLHFMSAIGRGGRSPEDPFRYNDDYVVLPLQSATQLDGLAHVYYDDELYNGVPADTVSAHAGAQQLGIENIRQGVVGRGVLIDLAAHRGESWLPVDHVITPGELDQALRRAGTRVGRGDIVLIRTGWRKKFLTERSAEDFMAAEPGIGLACIDWLHEHEVAAVCSDNYAVEVRPGEVPAVNLGVHLVLIRDMGMTLGELFDLEDLAADCAADGVCEFFFCASPLPVTGGVGSPVNPIAIK
jgi:kynurenine formamidase